MSGESAEDLLDKLTGNMDDDEDEDLPELGEEEMEMAQPTPE